MTYYVGKFSAKFFEDSQVWALITSCKYVKLNHLELRDKELVYWTDKEFITTTQASYLISLRFNYLSLLQGNHRAIQSYNPHQFCR